MDYCHTLELPFVCVIRLIFVSYQQRHGHISKSMDYAFVAKGIRSVVVFQRLVSYLANVVPVSGSLVIAFQHSGNAEMPVATSPRGLLETALLHFGVRFKSKW